MCVTMQSSYFGDPNQKALFFDNLPMEQVCALCQGKGWVADEKNGGGMFYMKRSCPPCAGSGRLLTQSGRNLLEFMQRHLGAGGNMLKLYILQEKTSHHTEVEITDAEVDGRTDAA